MMQGKPKVGTYVREPEHSYRVWDAANQSVLKSYLRSPAHGRHDQINPSSPTAAMLLGTAIHAAVLEPDLFDSEFVAAPVADARTKVGRALKAEHEARHPGKTSLPAKEFDLVLAARQAIYDNPIAAKLLGGDGQNELSYVWESDYPGAEGTLCKARVDRLTTLDGVPCLVDLKTSVDATPSEFQKSVGRFGYDLQAAFYLDGLATLYPGDRRFIFIVVEKTAPFGVSVCELEQFSLTEGRIKAERGLAAYAKAHATNIFDGYESVIHQIQTPQWARIKDDENRGGWDDFGII
jgi:hypothetical protein